MKRVVFIGSTGMVGQPVARELINQNFDLTLIARDKLKTARLFPGTEIVQADVLHRASLLPALEGKDILYLNLSTPRNASPSQPSAEREGIRNIIAAARDAGVGRIVLLSSLVQNFNGTDGFEWWLFDVKNNAAEELKASGIPYTIFYASSFMENLDKLMMKGNYIMLAGNSRMQMYFVAGEDYARQVARSFYRDESANREYNVQGSEAYTWDEAAKMFIDHYPHARLRTMKAPLGIFRFIGGISHLARNSYKILYALNNYEEKFCSEDTWSELGKPVITLAQYAASLPRP